MKKLLGVSLLCSSLVLGVLWKNAYADEWNIAFTIPSSPSTWQCHHTGDDDGDCFSRAGVEVNKEYGVAAHVHVYGEKPMGASGTFHDYDYQVPLTTNASYQELQVTYYWKRSADGDCPAGGSCTKGCLSAGKVYWELHKDSTNHSVIEGVVSHQRNHPSLCEDGAINNPPYTYCW